jgi:hypothetical protein
VVIELTEEQVSQYYYRSYTAVDGLWFMKVEERYGFDAALVIDDEVWKVIPKIQARWFKTVANMDQGIEALLQCFTTKLKLDRYVFTTEKDESGFLVFVENCPWLNLLVKSGREHLSEEVGTHICITECSTWASEFGNTIQFTLEDRICRGDRHCVFRFTQNSEADNV